MASEGAQRRFRAHKTVFVFGFVFVVYLIVGVRDRRSHKYLRGGVPVVPLGGGVRVGVQRHLVQELVAHEEREVRAAHQPGLKNREETFDAFARKMEHQVHTYAFGVLARTIRDFERGEAAQTKGPRERRVQSTHGRM